MGEKPCTTDRQPLEWHQVASAADTLFRVWHDGTDRQWAERAWDALGAAGLTCYAGDIERTQVKVRLLALACIYHDFCQIGRDESYDESTFLSEEGAELNLSNFRLGQLVGPAHAAEQIDAEDGELAEAVLITLMEAERPAICRVLMSAYGNEGKLAESLFATSRPERDQDDEEEEPRPDLLDENPNDAARVLDWITRGMPRL